MPVSLSQQNDRLARIACKAMQELVKQGKADFLLLQDEEVRDWWEKHVEADRKEQARKDKQMRIARLRKAALSKLTDEERNALGIRSSRSRTEQYIEDEEDTSTDCNKHLIWPARLRAFLTWPRP